MKNKIYDFLFEQENNNSESAPENNLKIDTKPKARKSKDSLDDQIDSLILLYEKRAIRDADDLMESLSRNRLSYLLEQEEEQEDVPPEEEPDEADDTASKPVGSEKMDAEVATEQIVPDLDIDNFTIKIARLLMNYKNLLQIENVIINRAKNFLDENYGDKFVLKYLEILDEQFGIAAKEFEQKDEPDAPFAIGANPAGAGMSGGS